MNSARFDGPAYYSFAKSTHAPFADERSAASMMRWMRKPSASEGEVGLSSQIERMN